MIGKAHRALGIPSARYRLSLPGPGDKFVDNPAGWAEAEAMLREALRRAGVGYAEAPGEAAFYGPKVDIQIVDAADREWTLSTVQLDFHQPAQFDLSYVDANGDRRRPVLVHRSIVGSLERLFGHLIEVHGGAFPAWYAPVQVVALPVGADQSSGAEAFAARCVQGGLRAEVDHDGSIGARIAARRRVPYLAVIGAREAADGSVALRRRDGSQLAPMPVAEAIALLVEEARPA
jgi:threonyl-tRNA synthetase